MDLHGFTWIFIDFYGFLWFPGRGGGGPRSNPFSAALRTELNPIIVYNIKRSKSGGGASRELGSELPGGI